MSPSTGLTLTVPYAPIGLTVWSAVRMGVRYCGPPPPLIASKLPFFLKKNRAAFDEDTLSAITGASLSRALAATVLYVIVWLVAM